MKSSILADALPELALLRDRFVAIDNRDFEAFCALAEDVKQFACGGFIQRFVALQLAQVASIGALPDIPGPTSLKIIPLVLDPGLTVAITLYEAQEMSAGPRTLYGLAQHYMLASFGPGPLTLLRYRQDYRGDRDVFDRSAILQRQSDIVLSAGEAVAFEANRDVYDVQPPPTGGSAVLVIGSQNVSEVMWEYSAATLEPLRVSAADLRASRLEFALNLLGDYGDSEAAAVMERFVSHRAHFIRWAAVRNIAKIDRTRGFELIAKCRRDPHPHVRAAADRSALSVEG